MRVSTTASGLLVGAIGAAVTWLWMNREGVSAPTASRTVEVQSNAPQLSAPREVPTSSHSGLALSSAEARGIGEGPSPAAPVVSPSIDALPPDRDDSTYFRMLSLAQAFPRSRDFNSKFMKMHEDFLDTPDDPEWGRPTEQTLRDFFQAQAADNRLEATSITCRSEGCEVQALGERMHVSTRDPSPPPAALGVDRPGGASIAKYLVVVLDLGDRTGYLLHYKRMSPKPVQLSPWEATTQE